jgi:hypothetical protein
MAYTIDFVSHRIKITSPQTEVILQDLYNFCKQSEASETGVTHSLVATASGKDVLGPGVQVGMTIKLLEDWQLEFWAGNYTATIGGGNIVAEGGDPVAYVVGGPQVEITLSAAATIVNSSGSGNGLTLPQFLALK